MLEAALLDQHDVAEVLRLGLYHLFGDWRDDPGVITTPCRQGRVSARRRIAAILDGESFLLERSVRIESSPGPIARWSRRPPNDVQPRRARPGNIRLVHLSDIHFGVEDAAACEAAIGAVADFAPDLVVVTGDLTRNGLPREFAAARALAGPSAQVLGWSPQATTTRPTGTPCFAP